MVFTIYSIGDAVFLSEIITSVAAIAGTGNIKMLAAIGALMGVIIIMVQSLFQGATQINFQHVLLGWILYAALFGPTTTVLIEDVYSGTVHVVDNAPIGIGVAGGMISKIGYSISEIFEQGYGAIEAGQTKRRYMESMEILNELQRNGNDSSIFTAWNYSVGSGADLRLSWQNYIRECSLLNIDTGVYGVDEMMRLPIETALKFDSSIFGTRVYLADGAGQDLTCTEAYAALNTATGNIKDNPDVYNTVNRILGYSPELSPQEATPLDKTQRALNSLGAVQTNAFDFLKVSVLEPIYMEAVQGRHQDVRDYSAAIMLNQAIQQRNVQWASEQSMFMTVARPLMTFFEGFIYAVTPVLAFLIMLGGFGLQLAVKYMQSLLWIQLWMPTLAITNLYIHSSVSYEMASKLSVGSEPLNSMYALNSAADILSNWIAVGGMLAAATPVISLFFVTGSTYAFTSLAQRIGGADHADEKQMSPDITKSGAYVQGAPAHNNDQVRGMLASGAENLMSSTSFGGNLSSGMSSASAAQSQKSEAFSNALGKAFSSSTSSEDMYAQTSALGRSLATSDNETVQGMISNVKQNMAASGIDSKHTDSLVGSAALKAAGKAGSENGSLNASLDGAMASQSTDSKGFSYSDAVNITDAAGLSVAGSQGIIDAISQATTDTSSSTFRDSLGESDSEILTKTASELNSATDSFNTLESIQQSLGSNLQADNFTLGSQVAKSDAAKKIADQGFIGAPSAMKAEAARLEEIYKADQSEGGYGMNAETAKQSARISALTNPAHFSPGGGFNGFEVAAKAIGTATGKDLAGAADIQPGKNSHLSDNAPTGNTRQEVESAVQTPERMDRAGVQEKARTTVDGTEEIKQAYEDGADRIVNAAELENEAMSAYKVEDAEDNMISGGSFEPTLTSNIAGTAKGAVQAVAAWFDQDKKAFQASVGPDGQLDRDLLEKNMQTQKDQHHEGLTQMGMSNLGLTHAQAQVFSASLGLGSGTTERLNQAYENLREEHAMRDTKTGQIIRDDDGRAVLSERQESVVSGLAHKINRAAHTGPVAVHGNLAEVNRLNVAKERLVVTPEEFHREGGYKYSDRE